MSDIQITDLQKNAKTLLRFRLREWEGRKFIDIRTWTQEEGQDKALPTKQGITVAPHLWPEFRQALAQVDKALVTAGLLDREDIDASVPF